MSSPVLEMVIKWQKPRTEKIKYFKVENPINVNLGSVNAPKHLFTVLMNFIKKKKKILSSIALPSFSKKLKVYHWALEEKSGKYSRVIQLE